MQLIIAEKPSLGRAIAHVLPSPHSIKQGYIECGENTIVTWCMGHLLEPSEPEGYKPQYTRWNITDLPICPDVWKLSPRSNTLTQLRVIGSLLQNAREVVHAGDPDREGQLLVDEVLSYFNVILPTQRLLINDLTPRAISVALTQLRQNSEFKNLSLSAQSRQRADWLYGINLTRAITLISRQRGREGVFTVGRVQTPVLGLIVKRDAEIGRFESKRYFTVEATFNTLPYSNTGNNASFTGQWVVPLSREIHCDEQGRLLNRKIAERVVRDVYPKEGEHPEGLVVKVKDKQKKESPPLPFSLSTLQIDAANRHKYSAQSVLDGCQILYEKHQLITYPRSDCRFLPEGHFDQRHDVLNTLIGNAPILTGVIQRSDTTLCSRAWNNKKVESHHAIIPTERHYDISALHERERNIYHLVCRNYIAQFYPDLITDESSIEILVAKELFESKGNVIRELGWQALFNSNQASIPLPILREGDSLNVSTATIKNHDTNPPQHFTDATLLSAMTNVSQFVEDADIRRTLRETDGLGTEATRAGIIETLFKRDYVKKNSHYLFSTEKGQDLIASLPPTCTKPDMTATWEASLETIHSGSTQPKTFLDRLSDQVGHLIEQLTGQPLQKETSVKSTTSKPPACPKCQSEMIERNGKYGKFWACSQYPNCTASLPWKLNTTIKAKSVRKGDSPPIPCPNCHAPLVLRTGKKGKFWGCSNYPSCNQSFNDIEGKPEIHIYPKR